MWALLGLCLLLWPALSSGRLVLEKGAFLQLPTAASAYTFNAGTATRATYDKQEHFLYVIGHRADVIHVINMTNPQNPERLATKTFDKVNQGLPNFIRACRTAGGSGMLAVSFETAGQTQKGHVHFYELLTPSTVQHSLRRLKDIVVSESYDPRPLAWTQDCSTLVLAAEGKPHVYNGGFEDPPADIELLIPDFGTTVVRREIPVIASKIIEARLRHVFHNCGNASESDLLINDMEPTAVHVDENDVAYFVFQENNAIATLDVRSTVQLKYYDLGTKDWSNYGIDTSYDDKAINLQSPKIRSFYQPRDLTSFEIGGKVYLATADTGLIRRYNRLGSCTFDESVLAASWRQQFADGLSPDETRELQTQMASNNDLGRLFVTKMKTVSDGWDPVYQGYDYVTTYGGRGFSILDPSNDMQRVFDSGDDFERYFTTDDASEADKAIFNAVVGSASEAQSFQFDKASPNMGPYPTAIAAGEWDASTQVVVIANGRVGGLYTYSVKAGSSAPAVNFESYVRRGQAGQSWNDAYSQHDTDAIGEPGITELLFIDDQGQKSVVAVSDTAGAVSFYALREVN